MYQSVILDLQQKLVKFNTPPQSEQIQSVMDWQNNCMYNYSNETLTKLVFKENILSHF
jgi:hypothetical protein